MLMFEFPFEITVTFLSKQFIPALQSNHLFLVGGFVLENKAKENRSVQRHFNALTSIEYQKLSPTSP